MDAHTEAQHETPPRIGATLVFRIGEPKWNPTVSLTQESAIEPTAQSRADSIVDSTAESSIEFIAQPTAETSVAHSAERSLGWSSVIQSR